jgi:ADP-ribose pyrophosphatase YjhB (NUDIX family)
MLRVVGCFLEYDGKFVVLLRRPEKPDGDTWGLPAGKVEEGESDKSAVLRELHEETGYDANLKELQYTRRYF